MNTVKKDPDSKELHKNEMTALSLYQLLGAPLHALIDAETQAAQATADFITRVGFVNGDERKEGEKQKEGGAAPDTKEHLGKLRMASFSHEKIGPDGKPVTVKVEVPFLSLLPIPALQIKDAEFDFYLKILDTYPMHGDEGPERKVVEKGILPVDLKATLGAEPQAGAERRSLEVQMKAKIRVEQADVPAGLSRLFHIMEQQVTAKEG
jgi:Protein of unknown function (DUF2589)